MIKNTLSFRRLGLRLALLVLLGLPELVQAQVQVFQYNQIGDVLAGFRKTGLNDTTGYEMVADLGSVTNFLNLSAGTTITITNFTPLQLTDAFTSYANLQWSAFSAFPSGTKSSTWVTPLWTFPGQTLWYTLPATNVNNQTQPPVRQTTQTQFNGMISVGLGAQTISGTFAESVDNTNTEIREPETSQYDLSAFIADAAYPTNGDFGASDSPLPNDIENETAASFTAAQRNDFYQVVPSGKVDPINLSTTTTYFVGYFLLNPSGTMTFTRASANAAPAAGTVTASATNGFGPLTVVFTNSASGSITNWVWNFGNGTIITNSTGGNVTNTYSVAGSYTVTLTVYGPGGSSTDTVANFIVTSPTPKINWSFSNNSLILSGTNCPVGVKYRVLTSTNLTVATGWKPIYTNTFASNGTFSYTNNIGSTNSFFIMVSP